MTGHGVQNVEPETKYRSNIKVHGIQNGKPKRKYRSNINDRTWHPKCEAQKEVQVKHK